MVKTVVVDTSVFIAGVLNRSGTSGLVLDHVFQNRDVLFSKATFAELERKLTSPKFRQVIGQASAEKLLARYSKLGIWAEPKIVEAVARDSDDDMFLALAKLGKAQEIVTLDKDLLVLNPWQGIKIVKPYDYLIDVQ